MEALPRLFTLGETFVKRKHLRRRVSGLKPPAPRRGQPGAVLTSDERRKRVAVLILRARLGRPPTDEEVVEFKTAGGITAALTPEFCDRRVAEAENSRDAAAAARWRSIAAGLRRLRAAQAVVS